MLAKKEYSCHELCIRLTNGGYTAEEILNAIKTLQNAGYINDLRFALCFIRYRFHKGIGQEKIKAELWFKHKIGQEVCAELFEQFDWESLALYLRIKKFGANVPGNIKDKIKQVNFLRQRGFTQAQTSFALKTESLDESFLQEFNGVFL